MTTYDAHRFVVALEHAGDAVEIVRSDARIEWVNPAFEVMTGYTRDEAIGQSPAALFKRGQHPQSFYDAIDTDILAGRTWRGELIGVRKDGTRFPVEATFTPIMGADGKLDFVIGIRRDLTERYAAQRAEQQRRDAAVFRTLVDVLPDAVLVLQRGVPVLANPALLALIGLPHFDALSGPGLDRFLQPSQREPFVRWLDELVGADGGPKSRQWQVMDARSQALVVEVTGLPWPDYAGGPALLLVARDVTERTRLHAQVVRADRLAALGVLAAGVSHEINNPLSYIRAAVDHLREVTPTLLKGASGEDRAEVDECLTDAADGVARISDIVTDFRTFSKASRERALVDVSRLAETTARVAQGEVKRRAQFTVDVEPLSPVRTDESQLGQVLLNLIIHAARSIEAGAPQDNRVTLRAFEDASDIVFRLQDTGPGIPPGLLDHIFEPFASTRAEDAHSGLGLSVSHTLAQSLGGSLRVVETSPRGTTFELRLPRSADAA